jgi:hypothetical protein
MFVKVVTSLYVFTFIATGLLLRALEKQSYNLTWMCNSDHCLPPTVLTISWYLKLFSNAGGVIIYIAVMVIAILRNKFNPVVGHVEAMRRQKKITITLGISCLITFIFAILIRIGSIAVFSLRETIGLVVYDIIKSVFAVISNVNLLVQPVLLIKRHKKLRQAVLKTALAKTIARWVSTPVEPAAPNVVHP